MKLQTSLENDKIGFRRRLTPLSLPFIASVSLLGLSGCVGADGLLLQSKPKDTTTIRVNGSQVVIGGTSGYCVNSRQNRHSNAGTIVILGPCSPGDSATGQGSPAHKGLLIASISADEKLAKAANSKTLSAYFRTKEGLKSLSRSGESATVEILGSLSKKGVYYVHTRDNAGPLIPDTTAEQWRGFFVVSDRMVSVSLLNFVDNTIPDRIVFAQLEEFAARIKSLNTSTE